MKKTKKEKIGVGLKLQKMNYIMAIITLAISVLLFVAMYYTSEGYRKLRSTTEDYIVWTKSANQMQIGSDYLTEQARLYAITGKKDYLDNYFTEKNVNRRRDNALEVIREEFEGSEVYDALQKAMDESVALMQKEYCSMRLKADSKGYDLTQFPEEIQNIDVSAYDGKSAEEKAEVARNMVFDDEYEGSKAVIYSHTSACLERLESEVSSRQAEATDEMKNLLVREQLLIIAFIAVVFCIVVLTAVKVFVPLIRAVPQIQAEKPIPVIGSYEYRFLAKTYNRMYEANRESKEKLAYEASHDALTGVLNRKGFEKVLERRELRLKAFLLLDVDDFKTINDSYGHAVGDRVLMVVAKRLSEAFTDGEYICRLGGDEFAVLSTVVSVDKETIEKKIAHINEELKNSGEDMPSVSVSAGVTFYTSGMSRRDLFRQADSALYATKHRGRCGCSFYEGK